MPVETLPVGQLQTNCYLYYDAATRKALIIDPGDDADFILQKIKDLSLTPLSIVATHGHFDHLLAATELKLAFNLPFLLHPADQPLLKRTRQTALFFTGLYPDPPPPIDRPLKPGQLLRVGESRLKVIATPGHTPGSVSLYSKEDRLAFVGDLLFAHGDVGRTDLWGGNPQKLQTSIKKILSLPENTRLYPGHGPATTVAEEKPYHR